MGANYFLKNDAFTNLLLYLEQEFMPAPIQVTRARGRDDATTGPRGRIRASKAEEDDLLLRSGELSVFDGLVCATRTLVNAQMMQGDVTEHRRAFVRAGRMRNKGGYIKCVAVHAKFPILESF